MSITPGYTNDEIRDIVYEYERQPHGTKDAWLSALPIGRATFHCWRRTVFDGDLDRGLIPRHHNNMEPSELSRREQAYLASESGRKITGLEQRIAELEASNSALQKSNDALGKAIGLLHELNAQELDDDPDPKNPSDS